MSDRRTHPDAAAIAGFIDGTLSAQESRGVAVHIAECDECVAEVSFGAAFTAEERGAVAPAAPARWWAYGVAAVLAVVMGGAGVYVWRAGGIGAAYYQLKIHPIAAAMADTKRPFEARLSGVPWSQKREVFRGNEDDTDVQLEAAAHGVLAKTQNSTSAVDAHARGVAQLFAPSEQRNAPATLSKAAAESHDPMVWNDLAVAYCQNGAYKQALEATNRALALKPDMREALFNRALILTRLLRDKEAVEAWNRYLAADPNSQWAAEARDHLGHLKNPD